MQFTEFSLIQRAKGGFYSWERGCSGLSWYVSVMLLHFLISYWDLAVSITFLWALCLHLKCTQVKQICSQREKKCDKRYKSIPKNFKNFQMQKTSTDSIKKTLTPWSWRREASTFYIYCIYDRKWILSQQRSFKISLTGYNGLLRSEMQKVQLRIFKKLCYALTERKCLNYFDSSEVSNCRMRGSWDIDIFSDGLSL